MALGKLCCGVEVGGLKDPLSCVVKNATLQVDPKRVSSTDSRPIGLPYGFAQPPSGVFISPIRGALCSA